jgi:hypothetical protein
VVARNLTWKGFGIDHWLATASQGRDMMTAELWALLREGAVQLPAAAVHRLNQIDREVRAASAMPSGTKVIIHI